MNNQYIYKVGLFFLMLFGLIVNATVAQQRTVTGKVVDNQNQEPLAGVNIMVVGTNAGTSTGPNGNYSIAVPANGNTLKFTFVGFKTKNVKIKNRSTVNVTMKSKTVEAEEIYVTGRRESRVKALEERKNAINVQNVKMANDVGKLPDRNIADALSRITGVSASDGNGDSRYVSIRGISPALNQVNVNGQTSAISDVEARAGRKGPLDILGSSNFQKLEVIKTLRPDLDAQGLGGQINLVTPSAMDRGSKFSYLQADYGYNKPNERDDYSVSGGYGNLYHDKKFGVFIGGSYSDRDYKYGEINGEWEATDDGVVIPAEQEFKTRSSNRARYSVNANLDYKFNDNAKVYLKTVYNNMNTKGIYVESKTSLDNDAVTVTSPTTGTASDEVEIEGKTRRQDADRYILNVTTGSKIDFGEKEQFVIEPEFTYSRAIEDRKIHYVESLVPGEDHNASYDKSNYFYSINVPDRLDPANIGLDQIRSDGGLQTANIYIPAVDLSWQANNALKLQIGGKATLRRRDVDEYSDRYQSKLAEQDKTFFLDGFTKQGPTNFFDKGYAYGPQIDHDKVLSYYRSNPGEFIYQKQDSETNSIEDDYNSNENIYAAYGMLTYHLGDLTFLGGARMEYTDRQIGANQANYIDDEYTGITPTNDSRSHLEFFPNAQLKYSITEDLVARAAYTKAIGRPDFTDIAPISELEANETSPGSGVYNGAIEIGNPDLKPFIANSYDLTLEYYFTRGSIISVSSFYKYIQNPIFERETDVENVTRQGYKFEDLELQTTENAESGKVKGISVGLQHQLTHSALKGLGVSANVSFLASSTDVFDRDDELSFFSQPDRIYNAELYYERNPIEARIAYQHVGSSLEELGDGPVEDLYEDYSESLDAKITVQAFTSPGGSQGFIFLEAENITGRNRVRFMGVDDHLAQNRTYSPTYRIGISWNL